MGGSVPQPAPSYDGPAPPTWAPEQQGTRQLQWVRVGAGVGGEGGRNRAAGEVAVDVGQLRFLRASDTSTIRDTSC